MGRPIGTQAELEARRKLAVKLVDKGTPQVDVAELLEVHPDTVGRWVRAHRSRGEDGLKAVPRVATCPCSLTEHQQAELRRTLVAGARTAGYRNELWTLKRVAAVIEQRFGIAYSESGVWHLLQRIGFSPQKPERYARERNAEAVENFRRKRWPQIKKGRNATATTSS